MRISKEDIYHMRKQVKLNIDPLELLARDSFSAFSYLGFKTLEPQTPYLHNWHLDVLGEYLRACQSREIKRLIINMPPRYLKSIYASVCFPAWIHKDNPSEKICVGSYSLDLARKHHMDTRKIMRSDWYKRQFPQVQFTRDQNTKTKYETTVGGHRMAVAVGGSFTGEGGNFIIIDDPHNTRKALSDKQREEGLIWYDGTAYSRLNDKKNGVIIVIMQRLHQNDLTGHLLKQDGWTHLLIPGIEEGQKTYSIGGVEYQRNIGDILHPEREGQAELDTIKKNNAYSFSSQYQQRPTPQGGGIIKSKWWKYYRELPAKKRIIQSWDTAGKAKKINDPSVCTTWLEAENGYYLLHVWRERQEYPELKKSLLILANTFSPDAIIIEDKSTGQSLLQELQRDTKLPIIPYMPEGEKVIRLQAQSSQIEAGRVFLPDVTYHENKDKALWLADFKDELETIPNATHDDQGDSLSQFLDWIKRNNKAAIPSIRSF